ncbi:P-loop NTPase fold protein [Rhodococcus erythropolis]
MTAAPTPDVSIKYAKDDLLGRADFAHRVADRIYAGAGGSSIVYGLAGPWGGGKTSVLNLVQNRLNQNTSARPDEWRIVDFTPWAANDPVTLTEEFYNAIAAVMPSGEDGKDVRTKLRTAANAVIPVGTAVIRAGLANLLDSAFAPGAGKAMAEAATSATSDTLGGYQFAVTEDPFKQRFDDLSAAIAKTHLRILVIVDDLDRLDAEELLTVFKAVRLLGRFDGVHYLLSYDETTILDVLQGTRIANNNRNRASAYLEKIIQFPFQLPPIQSYHRAIIFREQVESLAETHGASSDIGEHGNPRHVADVVLEYIPHPERLTLRSMYRLINQTDMLLTLTGEGELDFADALILMFFRVTYPNVYDQIQSWAPDLTRTGSEPWGAPSLTIDQWRTRIADAIGMTSEVLEITLIYRLLNAVFDQLPHMSGIHTHLPNASRKARHKEYLPRYFAATVPANDIADRRVRDEFAYLLECGTWPDDTQVAPLLADTGGSELVVRKLWAQPEILTTATSDRYVQAATAITRSLQFLDKIWIPYPWREFIYVLLGKAMASTDDVVKNQEIVAEYLYDFGLESAADVLLHPPLSNLVDHALVRMAARPLHNELISTIEGFLIDDTELNPAYGLQSTLTHRIL